MVCWLGLKENLKQLFSELMYERNPYIPSLIELVKRQERKKQVSYKAVADSKSSQRKPQTKRGIG